MGIEIPKIVLGVIGPEVVLVVAGIGIMLGEVVVKGEERRHLVWIGIAGVVGALVVGLGLWGKEYVGGFGGLVVVDRFSSFIGIVYLIGSGLTLLISRGYMERRGEEAGEYYMLILFSTVGMLLMSRAVDLIMVFIGLEVLSISIYILCGYFRDRKGIESALKYFLLGAFSSGILLYGIALVYGAVGGTGFKEIGEAVSRGSGGWMLWSGIGLVLVGFGFKAAVVPFHMWVPDVYEGAPAPVTGYMSVGVKAAAFAVLMRVVGEVLFVGGGSSSGSEVWRQLLVVGSVLTMSVGNIGALLQDNIKRMLGYSSIAHAGYILIGVLVGGEIGWSGVMYYLLVYTLMNLGAFGVVVMVGGRGEERVNIGDYAGVGRRYPVLGAVMAVFMFSLAGVPPFSGFVGKFYIFSGAVKAGYVWLAVVGVINSVVSVYYYLRVTVMMYMKEGGAEGVEFDGAVVLAVAVAVIFTVQMGVFPSLYLQLAKNSIKALL